MYETINALCADDYNQLLSQMKLNQKAINEAADALHRIIFREKSSNEQLVKYGKSANGCQRYLNKQTGRTQSDTSKSIVKYTKKTYEQWSDFIKLMLYGLSLKALATEIGYRIISTSPEYAEIAYDILSHHEKWDGTGYPRGIEGENIPIRARIIAIADAYDAMISERPYRKPLSHEEAIAEIKKHTGKQFDPSLVEVFLSLYETG